jgi:NTE family protein/lysophospholipid hydrolase
LALRQADQILFVATPGPNPLPGPLERRLREEPGFDFKRQHLVLVYPEDAALPQFTRLWRQDRTRLERVLPVRTNHPADTGRLARLLTGRAVGVVLGGGGARGFAHLGVLRALGEAGIPIDLMGGNSMGALIGSQWALGYSLEDIQRRVLAFAANGERPTLPVVSLLSGRRMEQGLRRLCDNAQVDGLWTPFFTAACNLSRAATTVLDHGPLWRAVLASNSPAGLLPPVLYDGELLVDGAILDNVPVDAMRQRLGTPLERRRGNGTVIAIDVDVQEPLAAPADKTHLRPLDKLRSSMGRGASLPGIGDILYRAGHLGGLMQRSKTVALSDFYLEPPVSEFSMMGYKRADEIVARGYEYATQAIKAWDRRHLGGR